MFFLHHLPESLDRADLVRVALDGLDLSARGMTAARLAGRAAGVPYPGSPSLFAGDGLLLVRVLAGRR